VAALTKWRAVQDSERTFFGRGYKMGDRVFTWEDGRPVHPDVIRQRFNRLSQRCRLPHIRLHDLRHSYATAALKAGINPKIVSHRLGTRWWRSLSASTYTPCRPLIAMRRTKSRLSDGSSVIKHCGGAAFSW
jgi:site-specific recombinase XerD